MNVTPVRNKEINLSDLLWYLMSKWRKILLFAVIFAFVFGATKAIPSLYRLRSSAYAAVIQESNEKALQEYEEEKMMLEERQALIRQQLAELDEYAEKSPLFQINPRNVYVSEQVYYIDVEASPVSDKLSSEAQERIIAVQKKRCLSRILSVKSVDELSDSRRVNRRIHEKRN